MDNNQMKTIMDNVAKMTAAGKAALSVPAGSQAGGKRKGTRKNRRAGNNVTKLRIRIPPNSKESSNTNLPPNYVAPARKSVYALTRNQARNLANKLKTTKSRKNRKGSRRNRK